MPGISFDRAVEYYDATRGWPVGVDAQLRDAVVRYIGATKTTRFLEIGVGTGRIALPFIQAGYNYTGADISQPMMDQLEQKLAAQPATETRNYLLVEADVTSLPFEDASFDVVIGVHILHLVDDWKKALQEARRVLQPTNSYILIGYDEHKPTANHTVNQEWDAILRDLGFAREVLHSDFTEGRGENRQNRQSLLKAYLDELGAQTDVVTLTEYETVPLSPRQMAERHTQRMYSSDWRLPDDIHAEAVRRIEAWLAQDCPNPDEALTNLSQFKAITAHW